MEQTHVNGTVSLQQRLDDPATLEALHRLLDRVDALDRALAGATGLAAQAPGLLAMVADTADDVAATAAEAGIDVEARLRDTLTLAEKLTAPQTVAVLSAVLDRMDQLAQLVALADQLPGLLAMGVDMADDAAAHAAATGIDLEATLALAGTAGRAVAKGQAAWHAHPVPPKLGLFGLLRALGDPDLQRALAFCVTLGRAFGQEMQPPATPPSSVPATR